MRFVRAGNDASHRVVGQNEFEEQLRPARKLADGSLLNLNTRSRAEIRFSNSSREVRLNVIVREDSSRADGSDLRLSTTTPLAAGEEVKVLSDGKVVKRTEPDVAQTVSWRQRRLVFRETALGEVVAQFNRYNADIQFHVDGAMAQRRITGTFDADEPQALIKFLEEDPNVELYRRADELVIRSRTQSDTGR